MTTSLATKPQVLHLYVEGAVCNVSAERAAEKVSTGEWYECDAEHKLPRGPALAVQEGAKVHIYHRNHQYQGGAA